MVLAAGNDSLWSKLCEALDAGDLAADPRFSSNALRTQNHGELEPLLTALLARQSVAHWCQVLGAAGIPCGPICNVEQVVNDPQVAARKMVAHLDHPKAGSVAMPNSPLKFSADPVSLGDAGATFGAAYPPSAESTIES